MQENVIMSIGWAEVYSFLKSSKEFTAIKSQNTN